MKFNLDKKKEFYVKHALEIISEKLKEQVNKKLIQFHTKKIMNLLGQ